TTHFLSEVPVKLALSNLDSQTRCPDRLDLVQMLKRKTSTTRNEALRQLTETIDGWWSKNYFISLVCFINMLWKE
nr:hypothetical protein [Tanacetum cinerariifolium]